MRNYEIAKIFFQIADFMNMEGIAFKPYAYTKAALSLENLKDDVGEIYKNGGLKALKEIPGIGKALAEAIEEYLKIPYLYSQETLWVIKSYLRAGRLFENEEDWQQAKIVYQKVSSYKTDEAKFAQERLDFIAKQTSIKNE